MNERQPSGGRLPEMLPVCLAVAGAALYLFFSFLAFLRYPEAFSPQNNNWLSDLGNRDLNPLGATFYVTGCVTTGIVLAAFFFSLSVWRKTGSKIQNWLLLAVQVAGGLAAFSLVMSAVYTEDQFSAHQLWSRLIYFGFAMVLFVAPFAFRRRGRRSIALIVVAACGYCSILASFIFASSRWLEWPAIAMILVFVCLVGWMSARGVQREPIGGRGAPGSSRIRASTATAPEE